MQGTGTYDAGKQIVPKAFYLHVLVAYQPEEHQDVSTHRELHEETGPRLACGRERSPHTEADADIAEIKQ